MSLNMLPNVTQTNVGSALFLPIAGATTLTVDNLIVSTINGSSSFLGTQYTGATGAGGSTGPTGAPDPTKVGATGATGKAAPYFSQQRITGTVSVACPNIATGGIQVLSVPTGAAFTAPTFSQGKAYYFSITGYLSNIANTSATDFFEIIVGDKISQPMPNTHTAISQPQFPQQNNTGSKMNFVFSGTIIPTQATPENGSSLWIRFRSTQPAGTANPYTMNLTTYTLIELT